jgi:hypothetical protein
MVQILVFIGVIALFAVFIYNGLVSSRNEVANVMGAVDATLKKRFDLIRRNSAGVCGSRKGDPD